MTTVRETIPEELRPEVEAALAGFNRQEDVTFDVTGILDPEAALEASGARELRLVLCGGDRCEQRSFHVMADGDGFDVALVGEAPSAEGQMAVAELDPPPGAGGWIGSSASTPSSSSSSIAASGDLPVAPSCGAT